MTRITAVMLANSNGWPVKEGFLLPLDGINYCVLQSRAASNLEDAGKIIEALVYENEVYRKLLGFGSIRFVIIAEEELGSVIYDHDFFGHIEVASPILQ